jgi:ribulose-phosphate 3-epimerase
MPSPHAALLAPSLLAGDHANLGASAREVSELGVSWLHLDLMDGHFVPNLTFGPETLAALRRAGSKLFFDTHLMLAEPHRYVEAFAKAGANLISIHIEPAYDHVATLARIRALGCQCGIVLNPGTPAGAIEAVLPLVDLVLVMTVQPGFGSKSTPGATTAGCPSGSRLTAASTSTPRPSAGPPGRTRSSRARRSSARPIGRPSSRRSPGSELRARRCREDHGPWIQGAMEEVRPNPWALRIHGTLSGILPPKPPKRDQGLPSPPRAMASARR